MSTIRAAAAAVVACVEANLGAGLLALVLGFSLMWALR